MMPHLVDPLPDHATVAVLGYGASGKAATRLLRHLGKSVIVADNGLTEAPVCDGVTFHLGRHDIGDATAVILSPSFNPEWPENRRKASLHELLTRIDAGELTVMSEVELGIRAFGKPIIAVGGTDGKSTTAALTHAIAPAFGVRAILGGNSWRAFCDVVMEAPADTDAAVVEISAFQLHRPHGVHPRVGIFTNLAFDHLDHYADFDAYASAKMSMFRHQGNEDAAVLFEDGGRVEALGHALAAQGVRVVRFGNRPLTHRQGAGEENEMISVRVGDLAVDVPFDVMSLQGAHNRRNLMAATLAWIMMTGKEPDTEIYRTQLASVSGLPHRVAFVRELDGVRYVDDSKATNVHAACVGIRSVQQPLIAIVGGVDKGLALDDLWDALATHGRLVIAIGELQSRIAAEAPQSLPVAAASTMEEAVAMAREHAQRGDVVMLSPASSSFDMFASFSARGDAFALAVRQLTSRQGGNPA